MKIKTRIRLAIILCAVLIVTPGALLFLSTQKMHAELEKSGIVSNIVKAIAELRIVTDEYLLYSADRALRQWKYTYDDLTNDLSEAADRFQDPNEKIALSKISKNVRRFKAVFDVLTTDMEMDLWLDRQKSSIRRELRERLIGDLLIKSQASVSTAFQLRKETKAKLAAAQERTSLFIIIFLVILTALVAAILMWLYIKCGRANSDPSKRDTNYWEWQF